MTTQTKYYCTYCSTKKQTKEMFDRHFAFCKFMHTSPKEHLLNSQSNEEMPSQLVLFQYVLDLTAKYEILEQKVEHMQKTLIRTNKKNFNEYIKTHPAPQEPYQEWFKSVQLSDSDLEILFENDWKECVKSLLNTSIKNGTIPLVSFTQKPGQIFVYDRTDADPTLCWRAMETEQLKQMFTIISQRITKKFLQWNREHLEVIAKDDVLRDRASAYMQKANGGGQSFDTRLQDIRKWLVNAIKKTISGEIE